MGCDIHSFAEVRKNGKWEVAKDCFTLDDFDKKYYKKEKGDSPFDWRDYDMFGFLANVRNYSHSECITGETRGLPKDSEYLNEPTEEQDWVYSGYSTGVSKTRGEELLCDIDYHSHNYITLKELLDWDYDKVFWDRRISRLIYREDGSIGGANGACLAEEGEGEMVSYRDFLGASFFQHIEDLKDLGEPDDVRVIFWFDN